MSPQLPGGVLQVGKESRDLRHHMLKQFSKTFAAHRSGILAYFDFDGLSTGPLEGTNNKIKTLNNMAYGLRDIEFFKLKMMELT